MGERERERERVMMIEWTDITGKQVGERRPEISTLLWLRGVIIDGVWINE
jgi:hypothetical protein